MAVTLTKEISDLINDPNSIKIVSTVDREGVPHTVIKQSLYVAEDGRIKYLELLESSHTYKNFTSSLWYSHKVSVSVLGGNKFSYQIKGIPAKILISGPEFESNYKRIREKLGDVDLAAICVIEPVEVTDETFSVRYAEQENTRPYFKHLDRLSK
ncbi:hypothetical protein [Clostridium aminobutyricum]|uniref:Pyridoxamine 5'-phosphate oxidase putative domain-containing protein n=1 Tax=Clostridium aminobutyricum TaxID=33953 RepID=A0A939DA49_CLOAM|nr:hypothetical protein [Clostridium aminobutyricum]MBN7773976.1 hypothetical protein [Clostridium aminobutyricum]